MGVSRKWVPHFIYSYVDNTPSEKCPNTEFFLVRIFPQSNWIRRDTEYLSVLSPNAGKYGPEKALYLDTFHAVTTSVVIISFITSYNAHLSHCAYVIAICSTFNLCYEFYDFIENKMMYEHLSLYKAWPWKQWILKASRKIYEPMSN